MHEIKGAKLNECTAYGAVLHLDLEGWGGLPGSKTGVRLACGEIQLLYNKWIDPNSPVSFQALDRFLKFMTTLDFKRCWYAGAGNPVAIKHLQAIGFQPAGTYHRLSRTLDSSITPTAGIEFVAEKIANEDFTRFFVESASGDPSLQWNSSRESSLQLFHHERLIPNQRDYFWKVLYANVLIGVYSLVVFRNMPNFKELPAPLCFWLESAAWRDGRAKEVIDTACAALHEVGHPSAFMGAEESEVERIELFESLGFKRESQYYQLVRELT